MSLSGDDAFETFQKYRPDSHAGPMAPEEIHEEFSCPTMAFSSDDPAAEPVEPVAVHDPTY